MLQNLTIHGAIIDVYKITCKKMNGFYVAHGKNYNGKHGGYIRGCCWKEEKEVL